MKTNVRQVDVHRSQMYKTYDTHPQCYLDVFHAAEDVMFRVNCGVVQTLIVQWSLLNCCATHVVGHLFRYAGRCRKHRMLMKWTVWWLSGGIRRCYQVILDVCSDNWVCCRKRIVAIVCGTFASSKIPLQHCNNCYMKQIEQPYSSKNKCNR